MPSGRALTSDAEQHACDQEAVGGNQQHLRFTDDAITTELRRTLPKFYSGKALGMPCFYRLHVWMDRKTHAARRRCSIWDGIHLYGGEDGDAGMDCRGSPQTVRRHAQDGLGCGQEHDLRWEHEHPAHTPGNTGHIPIAKGLSTGDAACEKW